MKKKIVAATMLSFAITLSVSAKPTTDIELIPPNLFQRVELKEDQTEVVLDSNAILAIPTDRPNLAPESKAKVIQKSKPKPATSNSIRGTASWYCMAGRSACHYQYSGGLYAAAGPALRVGNWRGRTVTVCANNCVNVKLIDWCACPSRAIDLYSDAFKRLAPLSSGTVRVRVSW
jgi:rare lipoprotein A (peptidoglycan hydrolase)